MNTSTHRNMMLGLLCFATIALALPTSSGATSLAGLAETRFGPLTQAEVRMLQAAESGDSPRSSFCERGTDPSTDPSRAGDWGKSRSVRASVIRWLFIDPKALRQVTLAGVTIDRARIEGELDLAHTRLDVPLQMHGCAISEDIDLSDAEIRMLDLRGSLIRGITANALVAHGDVLLSQCFHADRQIVLDGARIQGSLSLNKARISTEDKVAVLLEKATIDGSVNFEDSEIRSQKEAVSLEMANIKGDATFNRAKFFTDAETAVSLTLSNIGGNLWFTKFESNSLVDISLATIGGNLTFKKAQFSGPDGKSGLQAINTQIKGAFIWMGIGPAHAGTEPPHWDGLLDLTFSKVGGLADDAASWPNNILMNEFVYEKFDEPDEVPKDLTRRLEWLGRQSEFRAQPYLQLARILALTGRDDDARAVLIEKEDRRHKDALKGESWYIAGPALAWNWILRSTIGYGYSPARALPWSLAIVAVGGLLFGRGYRAGLIVPSERDACVGFIETRSLPPHYQPFSSFVYSLEAFLPFVDLHQGRYWLPTTGRPGSDHRHLAGFLPLYLRVHVLAGWLLSTLVVAGLTGLVHTT